MPGSMEIIPAQLRRMIEDARTDRDRFWSRAAEKLPWFRKWDSVFERQGASFRWFVNGQTNLCYNALDHHVLRGWGGHAALIYENENGERRVQIGRASCRERVYVLV